MSLKQNLVYNITLNILNVLFPIITVPYISRVLGAQGIGYSSFILTYSGYFMIFATLGISIYGTREIAKVRENQKKTNIIVSELMLLMTISTLIISLLYILSILTIPKFGNDKTIMLLAGLPLFLSPLSIDWYYSGLEMFKIITIRSAIIKVLSILGLFIFVKTSKDILPYILLNIFATVANNLWNIIFALKQGLILRIKGINFKKHLKPMLILFSSVIAINIYTTLDTLMLGFLNTYDQVGLYSSAIKIPKLIIPIFSAIGIVLLPRLSFNQENNNSRLNAILLQKSFDFTIFFSIPSAIFIMLISERFVPFFFGSNFIGSILPLQILAFLIILSGINTLFGIQILIGLSYDKNFLSAVICAAITSFIINLYLMPKYGAVGASISSIIAEIVEFIIIIFNVYHFTKIRISFKTIMNNLICSIPFIIILLLESFINNSKLLIFISAIICSICYLSMQYFLYKHYLLVQYINELKHKFFNLVK